MSKHDAEMFRQLRRTQGSPTRDPFSAPKFLRTPELRCLVQLPWPRNLFGEPATGAKLLAEAAQLPTQAGHCLLIERRVRPPGIPC